MASDNNFSFKSLEDFLISKELTVDAVLDDGLGAQYPVKGREIEATILFADISLFSERTKEMPPTAVLIYVNRFFTWITNEALKGIPCIIDKYIGDQIMIVFSNEFGSQDHFLEALQAARWFAERDILGFHPHMGVASGIVTVGYVGTPLMYNCTVFGDPVTIASRCANIKIKKPHLASIIFPADHWKNEYDFKAMFKPDEIESNGHTKSGVPIYWKKLPIRNVKTKNTGDLEIISIVKSETVDITFESAKKKNLASSLHTKEDARKDLESLLEKGKYKPIYQKEESI